MLKDQKMLFNHFTFIHAIFVNEKCPIKHLYHYVTIHQIVPLKLYNN